MNPGDFMNDYSLEITARDVDRLGKTGGHLTRVRGVHGRLGHERCRND
jgi:hypothetical protein